MEILSNLYKKTEGKLAYAGSWTSEIYHRRVRKGDTLAKNDAKVLTGEKSDDTQLMDRNHSKTLQCVGGAVVGVAVLTGGVVYGIPLALGAIGFTGAGIAAKSFAAGWMSSVAMTSGGGVVTGSAVAVCQSVGAAGVATSTAAAAGAIGAVTGGAAAVTSNRSGLTTTAKTTTERTISPKGEAAHRHASVDKPHRM